MAEPTEQELIADAVSSLEQEIHEEAFQDKPADEPETAEEAGEDLPEAEASDDGQPRDEQGRFASKDKPAEQQAQPQQQEQRPGEQQQGQERDDETSDVPRWRLREIAEERRQAQAERDQLRAELIRLQTMAQRQQQQPQPQEQQQQEIDPLLDPQGFANRLRNEFAEQLRVERLNMSLAMSHQRHGEKFEKAYEALVLEGQRGNRQIIDQLTRQGNPGEAIVRWYGERELLRETNGDLNAFKAKVREELLKDPEFLKQAAQARSQGAQQQPGRPNNITRLPPSLSRATGTTANVDPNDTDDSERAVFDYAFR
jgi:hypothetical protein